MISRQERRLELDKGELAQYLLSCFNASLKTNDESSLSNSYQIKIGDGYFDFIPNLPTSYQINSDFAAQLEGISAVGLYPYYTVFTNNGLQLVPTNSSDIHTARAVRVFLKKGIYEREIFDSVKDIPLLVKGDDIYFELQNGFYVCATKGIMTALTGRTSAGKTHCAIVLLELYKRTIKKLQTMSRYVDDGMSGITVVDPKLDKDLFYWTQKSKKESECQIQYLTPTDGENNLSFLDRCSRALKECIDVIHSRAHYKIIHSDARFIPRIFYCDEMMSLVSLQPTKTVKAWLGLIDQLTLMGRATNVVLIASSQTFPVNSSGSSGSVMSSSARDQLTLKILFSSHPSLEECRYLFKEVQHPENIVLNRDQYNFGIGIIEGPDGRVLPFSAPLIKEWRND